MIIIVLYLIWTDVNKKKNISEKNSFNDPGLINSGFQIV